ncbi:MAG: CHAT domain-containing protein [Deltaproteobacteria bacterium]|nr:CHAT domain-containing protein [Deltaproteobacteria bacterium]
MSSEHDALMAFVDGELPPDEQARFREHLAGCRDCQSELAELLQLRVLEEAARAEPPRAVVVPLRARRGILTGLVAAALAAGTAFALLRTPSTPLAWAPAPTRSYEGWLSYPAAGGHRPYDAMRAADQPARDEVPLATLAELEARGDRHGLGVAWLVRREPRRAVEALEQAGDAVEVRNDLAAAQLAAGDVAAALRTIDGVLARAPELAAAHFNRALIAERAGLPRVAHAELELAAGTAPEGWRDEARTRAGALLAASTDDEALARVQDLLDVVARRGRLDPALVARSPAQALEIYTLAVLAAENDEELARLEPIADALEAALPNAAPRAHLAFARSTAPARFAVAPWFRRLAITLASLSPRADRLVVPPDVEGIDDPSAFFDRVLAAGADDQRLAAIFYYRERAERADAWAESARRGPIPFFTCGAGWAAFTYDWLGGHTARDGLRALGESVDACRAAGVDRNVVRAEHLRANVLFFARDLVRAGDAADAARADARRLPDLRLEAQALEVSFNVARYRHDRPMTRILGEELARLDPRPERAIALHEALANLALFDLDRDAARREMEAAAKSGLPPTLVGAFVLADLVRMDGRAEDARAAEDALVARADELEDPATQLLVRHVRALMALRTDRDGALRALAAIVDDARAISDDATARSASAYSASLLALEAGEDARFDDVLETIADEQSLETPMRCAVALERHLERSVIAARDANGATVGAMLRGAALPVVPPPIEARLRACDEITVLARPSLHGRSGLLEPGLAHAFAVGAPRRTEARDPDVLYVYGANPPASEGLAPLAPLSGELTASARVLTGERATPRAVLAEMGEAGWVEIHAHGALYGDSDAAAIALSPDARGWSRLRAEDVQGARFASAPVVVLAACDAAGVRREDLLEPSGLAVALLGAGARAVLASDAPLPDAGAAAFFREVRRRYEAGASIARALEDARMAWPASSADWTRSVVVFEGGRKK